MKLTISGKKISIIISLIGLILYAFTPGLTSSIFLMNGKGVYLWFAFCIITFSYLSGFKLNINNNAITSILAVLMIAVLLVNNYNIRYGDYEQLIRMSTFLILYLFWSNKDNWSTETLYLLCIFSAFFMIMTLYEIIDYDFFEKSVMPLFSNYNSIGKQITNHRQGYVAGFTANPGINAIILTVGFGISYGFAVHQNKRLWKVVTVAFLASIFITGKRGQAVFALLSLIISYFVCSKENLIKKYGRGIAAAIVTLILMLVLSNYIPAIQNVLLRFQTLSENDDITTGRTILWAQTVGIFLENPILGKGWEATKYIIGINTHNVYLQLLGETGIVGFFIYTSFFIVSLIHCIKAIRYANNMFLQFSLYFQIFFILYCFTGNPLYDATSFLPYIVACALSELYYRNNIINRGNI